MLRLRFESWQRELDHLARDLADAEALRARERSYPCLDLRGDIAPQLVLFDDLFLFPVSHAQYDIASYVSSIGYPQTYPQVYPQTETKT